jgi:catechol 2,3-dioxygenase-like lactoylglutathione lyase family enzyme
MKRMWNLGIKTSDLDADLAFLAGCGATEVEKGIIAGPDGDLPFGSAFLGPQRLLLFPRVIYEDALPEPMKCGLAHIVFEVEDVAAVLAQYRERGVSPLWGPKDIATPFGRRSIVFWRSPSGLVFETFQALDPPTAV